MNKQDRRCVLCGSKLASVRIDACDFINKPACCINHAKEVQDEMLAFNPDWPASWYGHCVKSINDPSWTYTSVP